MSISTSQPSQSTSVLEQILSFPARCEAIFLKVLSNNDDAGRHGVLVPVSAYPMFPSFSGFNPTFAINYTESLTYLWDGNDPPIQLSGRYKHYHRYPERRLTRLPTVFNNAQNGAAILVAKIGGQNWTYEVHLLLPTSPAYSALFNELGLESPEAGAFFVDLHHRPATDYRITPALHRLLTLFDEINSRGYIRTLRQGPTGVGYTFETLIGIEENNISGPDFEDIEIKCYRKIGNNRAEKKNLFLKEPRWNDQLPNLACRVRTYGYIDEAGRPALYSAVGSVQNSHGLALQSAMDEANVYLTFNGRQIAQWSFGEIQRRLEEKLTHTAFIGARKRGNGATEEFLYGTFTYCRNPSVEAFNSLIESGHVILEMRMHVRPDGSVRNHGSCFRVMEDKLPDLYAEVRGLREH